MTNDSEAQSAERMTRSAQHDANDTKYMTPRDKFIMALEGKQPPGRVPHFELVFYLTMEAFGKVHPTHRVFDQWDQMSESEKRLHRQDI